MTAVAYSLTKR